MHSFDSQLDKLLKKDPAMLVNEHIAAFERVIAKTGERYVLFGAGRLGQFTLTGLRKSGVEPLAFADNNSDLWGTRVDGLEVLSPQSASAQFGKAAIFVIAVYTSSPVWEQLSSMGLNIISFAMLAWRYPQALTPHGGVVHPHKIFMQKDDVRETLSLWADDESHREYLGQLRWQTSLDPSVLPPHLPQGEIYFGDKLFAPLEKEVFVDCGAFDGDSIQEFINRRSGVFDRIIAIEPDPVNCKALEARLGSFSAGTNNRVKIVQSAVGSKRELVTFNATGTAGSSVGTGSYKVQCAPLDELLSDIKPTFIKMDIEGAEPDALLGAKKIIEKQTPVLAICLYHAQEHLWQIPLLLRSFNVKYDLFLRRYADECWEIVCYAVPKTRLII